MFHVANMTSHSNSLSEEASCVSSFSSLNPLVSNLSPHVDHQPTQQKIKRKRNLPGNPDPDAEVIALSPKTLMTTNRFVCEICNKGFQRDQNLQLHRRGHNLPWKLKQRNSKDVIKKKAYVCPEPSCVHHHPSRALGDLTGIKKHFCRKHGEKKWKCEKCSKIYAVQSDWKAHTKTCGTREYRCDCGTLFSRKDSFVTHRAFCDALAEESARLCAANVPILMSPSSHANNTNTTSIPTSTYPFPLLSVPNFFTQGNGTHTQDHHLPQNPPIHVSFNPWDPPPQNPTNPTYKHIKAEQTNLNSNDDFQVPSSSPLLFYHDPGLMTSSFRHAPSSAHLSATALLQKAATVGAHSPGQMPSTMSTMDIGCMGGSSGGGGVHVSASMSPDYLGNYATKQQKSEGLTRDFLGLTGGERGDQRGNVDVNVNVNVNLRSLLSYTGGVEFPGYNDRDHSLIRTRVGFVSDPHGSDAWGNC
ncbi:protein indeterminate-domain 12-like [Apium graveolens]|uniref:protein indeterminate-domain 12-like n=1 Tax=Apium graveolens TaxID=4045 RepID=UPI003D7A280E